MKDILIIGAGGVGKETAWIIEQINEAKKTWNIIGFIDDNQEIQHKNINGYQVVGRCVDVKRYKGARVVCAIANYKVKKQIVSRVQIYGNEFVNIIHPSVYILKSNHIGQGNIIYPGVVLTTNISIGNHTIISPKCGIGHESNIHDYSSILWNVNISGNVTIEEGCFIGTGATILQNINICRESMIGAGSVVLKNIEEKSVVVGVPGKVIKKINV